MASGLPVVTTDDPGYDMYGLDPGLVTLLGETSPPLGDVITALVADPGQRRRMAQYSHRFAEDNFSWARHVATLVGAFESVMATSEASPAGPVPEVVRS
jgi:glycosyltransferase involved in cell wall biosynthesis